MTDTICVREQLAAAIRDVVRVRVDREHHPYGSSTAVETLPQVDLTARQVDIEVVCDTLPVHINVPVTAADVSFRCTCRLRGVTADGGAATYDVECE